MLFELHFYYYTYFQSWPCGEYCIYDQFLMQCVSQDEGCSLEGSDINDGNGICSSRLCGSKIPSGDIDFPCGVECVQGIDLACKLSCEV
jgi:hypothetical protein